MRGERIRHESRQVERAQIAGAVRGQRDLAAGIRRADPLRITEVVERAHAVDEDDAGLRALERRLHDALPQVARVHGAQHVPPRAFGRKDQRPLGAGVDRVQEAVGDEHGEIEARQRARLPLRGDEGLDVGVIAAQRRHHRAAPCACRLDRCAHRVPDVHERHRARCGPAGRVRELAGRAQRREVVTDSAALLQRQRAFAQRAEDAVHRIVDLPHHEAVEKRHAAAGARACKDASAREKAEIGERLDEPALPDRPVGAFDSGKRSRDPFPRRVDRRLRRFARRLEAITASPDLFGERVGKCRHREMPARTARRFSYLAPCARTAATARGPRFAFDRAPVRQGVWSPASSGGFGASAPDSSPCPRISRRSRRRSTRG